MSRLLSNTMVTMSLSNGVAGEPRGGLPYLYGADAAPHQVGKGEKGGKAGCGGKACFAGAPVVLQASLEPKGKDSIYNAIHTDHLRLLVDLFIRAESRDWPL